MTDYNNRSYNPLPSNNKAFTEETIFHILNDVDALIFVSEPKTNKILFVNDKMAECFNVDKSNLGSHTCWQLFGRGDKCSWCPTVCEGKSGSVILKTEVPVGGRWYDQVVTLTRWDDGRIVYLHRMADITALKEKEESLRLRVKQQKFVSQMSQNFLTVDSTQEQVVKLLSMSGRFMGVDTVTFYKYDAKAATITNLSRWVLPESAISREDNTFPFKEGIPLFDTFLNSLDGVVVNDVSEDSEKYKIEIDIGFKAFMAFPIVISNSFWGFLAFACSHKRVWTEGDKYIGSFCAGILSGVLARYEAEKGLKRLSSLAATTSQYVATFDKTGKFSYFNPATSQITGYTPAELYELGAPVLYDKATSDRWDNEFIPQILEHGRYEFEIPLYTKSGKTRIMSFCAFTIGSGDDRELASIATDVTDQKKLEAELIKSKEKAEQASIAKGEFLSRMSHEIRTPINAIMGMANIGKTSKELDKKDYCLDKIDSASTHLLGIINDILDMSKIEANKFELSETEFDIEKMLFDVTNVINFRIEEKNQVFLVHIGKDVPKNIISDEMRLKQVITNLLSNACKFTPEGGRIELNVSKIEEDIDSAVIKVKVSDSGIGISQEQQAKLFNSFEQADGSISRKFGGTGLGLVISKRIVNLMGGEIKIESELGKGADFIFSVKVKKSKIQQPLKLSDKININNLRVMAVDDSADIRDYFLNVMDMFSIKCDVAANGEEALNLISQSGGQPYNIFFVDWQMPGMNGVELAEKIRDMHIEDAVVIMISMSKWSEIEAGAKAAGVSGYIPKPLFPSSLMDIINEMLSGSVKEAKETAAASADACPDFSGKTILIAEDVDINREIIATLLAETNINIEFAENGTEAVEKFEAAPDKYDAVLMDIQMPEMDGFEATKHIRALNIAKAKAVPIVAMTANVFAEDIEKCVACGMNDHLGKPVNLEAIFEKLTRYLPATK